ncbi:MAG: hypothetical protein JOZ18_02050 [Chloroflexi bacterium]|nr:hypothetical protein [Chloroflexota bacterium]
MTTTLERFTVVTPANWVPGPKQGHWSYNHYAALPDDGQRYEIVGDTLPSQVVPTIAQVPVEQFFV